MEKLFQKDIILKCVFGQFYINLFIVSLLKFFTEITSRIIAGG